MQQTTAWQSITTAGLHIYIHRWRDGAFTKPRQARELHFQRRLPFYRSSRPAVTLAQLIHNNTYQASAMMSEQRAIKTDPLGSSQVLGGNVL